MDLELQDGATGVHEDSGSGGWHGASGAEETWCG
jgi:hypothetical protein